MIIFLHIDNMSILISKYIKWIERKGGKILFIDYSECKEIDLISRIQEATDYIMQLNEKELHTLIDARKSYANNEVLESLKKSAKTIKPVVEKSAIIGMTETQKIILKVVNMFSNLGLKLFDDLESAEEWLIS
ncbi:hypothetical protein B6U98_04950 [Thermoplasmatales archaeon ex4572_165]|nr:MAG: hypothetical protein B6U98_04950 [Thermoplasmatales archaeon ex4572_165]